MNRKQAQMKAEKLFGEGATVVRGGHNRRGIWTAYRVFDTKDGSRYGRGNSFEAALADAEKRMAMIAVEGR